MPIPISKPTEEGKEVIVRCMSDPVMGKEYKNKDQRLAICAVQYRKK